MYKIFMVEDDEIIARSIREHLQAWNYDVCCVEDFSNVVAEFVRFDPQLVLMDITLPFLTDTIGAVKSEKYRKYRSSFCPQRQIT